MTSAQDSADALARELQAAIIGLQHARRELGDSDLSEMSELWQHLERCAARLRKLERDERGGLKPMMLALMDELHKTISLFDAEHHQISGKLKSTQRNLAADAAYRQARAR